MTFNAKIDTSTGHMEITGELGEDEEEELISNDKVKASNFGSNIDSFDREYLSKQFFELNK